MKKKIIGSVFVVAFAIVAGYNVYNSQKATEMSDLVFDNIEALSQQTESGGKGCKLKLTHICETSNGDRYLYRNK